MNESINIKPFIQLREMLDVKLLTYLFRNDLTNCCNNNKNISGKLSSW